MEYDPSSDTWVQLDSDILPRMSESMGIAINNKFYVNNGLSPGVDGFYVYDLDTQTAIQLANLQSLLKQQWRTTESQFLECIFDIWHIK